MRGDVTSRTQSTTDLPALTDQRAVDVEPERGEVLAEDSAGQWASELRLPEVQVLASKGVDGLVGTTVRARIADERRPGARCAPFVGPDH